VSEQVYVCIVKDDGTAAATVLGPMGERQAERVAGGASINLNHEEWHISVLTEAELPEGFKEQAK